MSVNILNLQCLYMYVSQHTDQFICVCYEDVNGFVRISTAYIYFLSAMVDIEKKYFPDLCTLVSCED